MKEVLKAAGLPEKLSLVHSRLFEADFEFQSKFDELGDSEPIKEVTIFTGSVVGVTGRTYKHGFENNHNMTDSHVIIYVSNPNVGEYEKIRFITFDILSGWQLHHDEGRPTHIDFRLL